MKNEIFPSEFSTIKISQERLKDILAEDTMYELSKFEYEEIQKFIQKVRISTQIPKEDYASSLVQLSRALYNNFYYEDSNNLLQWLLEKIDTEEPLSYKFILGKALHFKGMIHFKMHQFQESIVSLRNALFLFEEDEHYIERIYDSLGQAFKQVYHFEEALYCFGRSVELKKKRNDQFGLSISYGGLGEVYTSYERYSEAEEYLELDLQISREIQNSYGICLSLLLLIRMCNKYLEDKILQNYLIPAPKSMDKVEEYFLEISQIIKTNPGKGYSEVETILLLEKAKYYSCLQDYKRAEANLTQAKTNILRIQNLQSYIGKYHQVASLNFAIQEKFSQAKEQIELAIDYFRKENFYLELAESLEVNAKLFFLQGEKELANQALKEAIQLCENMQVEPLISYYEGKLKKQNEKEWILVRLQRYIGRDVINELLNDQANKKEKIPVSIFFSDIRGFTNISEKLKPDQLLEMLNLYMNVMTRIVLARGGTVNKFIGDAIMAYFGYPNDKEKSSEIALDTSLEMIEELPILNRKLKHLGFPEIRFGIGLHYGEVIAGRIGSLQRKEFTILGDNVNLTSRLEGLTSKYGLSIVASGELIRSIPDCTKYEIILVDKALVKGKEQPVEMYTVYKKDNFSKELQENWKYFEEGRTEYLYQNWEKAMISWERMYLEELAKLKNYYIEMAKNYFFQPPDFFNGIHKFDNK